VAVRSPPAARPPIGFVMSMNVQAYGAPARLTLRDYQIASTAVTPQAPHAPPAKKLDQFTPSDRTAAPNSYVTDSLRLAALRRDAAPPAIAESDRPAGSTEDSAIAKVAPIDAA
jgi:hypothetical protein